MTVHQAVQSLDRATSNLLEQQVGSRARAVQNCNILQVMMDNIGSTSPVRPAPPQQQQLSPPLFMSALSKLHGAATDSELQAHTPPPPSLPPPPLSAPCVPPRCLLLDAHASAVDPEP